MWKMYFVPSLEGLGLARSDGGGMPCRSAILVRNSDAAASNVGCYWLQTRSAVPETGSQGPWQGEGSDHPVCLCCGTWVFAWPSALSPADAWVRGPELPLDPECMAGRYLGDEDDLWQCFGCGNVYVQGGALRYQGWRAVPNVAGIRVKGLGRYTYERAT